MVFLKCSISTAHLNRSGCQKSKTITANDAENLSSYHFKKLNMKTHTLLTGLFILLSYFVPAQTSNYKVVFDMTSKDSVNQQSLIRQLSSIRESNPAAKLEVVIYGQGLGLVTKEGSAQQSAVSRLL